MKHSFWDHADLDKKVTFLEINDSHLITRETLQKAVNSFVERNEHFIVPQPSTPIPWYENNLCQEVFSTLKPVGKDFAEYQKALYYNFSTRAEIVEHLKGFCEEDYNCGSLVETLPGSNSISFAEVFISSNDKPMPSERWKAASQDKRMLSSRDPKTSDQYLAIKHVDPSAKQKRVDVQEGAPVKSRVFNRIVKKRLSGDYSTKFITSRP